MTLPRLAPLALSLSIAAMLVVAPNGSSESARRLDCAGPASPTVLRPTEGGKYAYATRERQLASSRVVVHYVTRGRDAPPATDDDHDGNPDYVEQIAASADQAFAFYGRPSFQGKPFPGFETTFCDVAGPSPQLDIYVKQIPPFGQAVTPKRGAGGAFMMIRPRLEHPRVGGGMRFTVAHELFHIVQFNYVADGMPQWTAEGTANAMAFLFDGVDHLGLIQNVDRWFRAPATSLYDRRNNCDRCYGGILMWATLATQHQIVTDLFSQMEQTARSGRALGNGVAELEQVMSRLYQAQGLQGFASGALYLELRTVTEALLRIKYSPRSRPPPKTYELHATARARTRVGRINGLAAHYIPISLPRSATGVEVFVRSTDGGPGPHFQLALGFRPTGQADSISRLLWPEARVVGSTGVWGDVISTSLKNSRERAGVRLLVSSSRASTAPYRVTYRACTNPRCPERGLRADD